MSLATKSLGELIAEHMTVPGDVPEPQAESDFIISGLRAASSANSITRRKILSDIADIMACKSQDLEFLFNENPVSATQKYEVMVPDFQTELFAIAE